MREKFSPITLSTLSINVQYGVETRDLVKNPNWGSSLFKRSDIYKSPVWSKRRQNRSMYIPPTPYYAELDSENAWKGNRYGPMVGGYFVQIGAIPTGAPLNNTALPVITNERDLAIIKALMNLKDEKVNLSLAYAERSKVSALMLTTAKDLAGAYKALRKGNVVKAYKHFKIKSPPKVPRIPPVKNAGGPKRWLEYQYGWNPLLMDLDGACRALAERDLDAGRYRVTALGRCKVESLEVESYSTYFEDVKAFHKLKRASFVRLDYTMQDSSALSTAAALGLTNPANLAWELLPFSFMLDWYVPVGDFISCLDAALGYDFLGGCYVDVTENKSLFAASGKNGYGGYYTANSHKWKSVRQGYGVSPFPRFPGLKPKTATNKNVASALSIIAGVFGGNRGNVRL